jgi:hypothetical protein
MLLSGFSPLQPSPMTVATVAKVSYKSLILLVGDPANREINREFCKLVAFGAAETPNKAVVAGLLMQIPYSMEQGIILVEQGIPAQEQGILLAKPKFIAG